MIRRVWTLVFGGGLAALSLSSDTAPAVPPQPDWVVTLNARKALWNDGDLVELNLGVRVRNGEALVWGPVLNETQAAEAIARLKLVPGVETVINETFTLPANDLLRQKLKQPSQTTALVTLGGRHEAVVKAIPSTTIDLIEDVRRSDNRFQKLRVTLQKGIVDIEAANDAVAAADFAARIRNLPGVNGVRLRQ